MESEIWFSVDNRTSECGYVAALRAAFSHNSWLSFRGALHFVNHSIIEPVLLRDLLSLVCANKPALFRQAFRLCLAYPAMEVSLQKLLG
jgi:hypothetical protein